MLKSLQAKYNSLNVSISFLKIYLLNNSGISNRRDRKITPEFCGIVRLQRFNAFVIFCFISIST